MGTPDFAVPCLDMLIQDGHQVTVVTQPDRPQGRGRKVYHSAVKIAAQNYGLNIMQPESVRDAAFLAALQQVSPEIIVVVAFGQLLPVSVLTLPPAGCINVHASLLPRYRGAAPIQWAIMNGEEETGVTTMFMAAGMDTGDIILQAKTIISPEETAGELCRRLAAMGAETLRKTLQLLVQGKAPRIPQDASLATYAPLLRHEHEWIDWSRSAKQIHNQIRALNPRPGAYTKHRGRVLKCWYSQVLAVAGEKKAPPGTVAAVNEDGISVYTGLGTLLLTYVQPESKTRMHAADYARGYKLQPGEILG